MKQRKRDTGKVVGSPFGQCGVSLGLLLSSIVHRDAQMAPSSENSAPSWSLTIVFGGPYCRIPKWSMAASTVFDSRSLTISPCAQHMCATIIQSSRFSKSNGTPSLNWLVIVNEAIGLLDRRCHSRQVLQVSTTFCTSASTWSGAPAACSRSFILFAGACHNLECNWRRI